MAKKQRKSKKTSSSSFNSVISKFKDQDPNKKFTIIVALLFFFFGIYLFISITSFLFTGYKDHSAIQLTIQDILTNPNLSVHNVAGRSGIRLADFFVRQMFGFASYGIVLLFIMIPGRITGWKFPLFQYIWKTLAIVAWSSISLGYICAPFFQTQYIFPGGAYGLYISQWSNALIGSAGTFLVLFALMFTFLAYQVDEFIPSLKRSFLGVKNKYIAFKEKRRMTKSGEVTSQEDGDSETHEDWKEEIIDFQTEIESSSTETPIIEKETVLENEIELDSIEISTSEVVKDNESDNKIQFELDLPEEPKKRATKKEDENKEHELQVQEIQKEEEVKDIQRDSMEEYDPTLELSGYKYPTLDLLIEYPASKEKVTDEELHANKDRIVQTLLNYGIKIENIKATVGPTITLYEIVPAKGVRINKIKNLEDDIALSLSALGIRIIAPIPGQGTIGIEVPNQKPTMVPMREIIGSKKFSENKYDLPLALGKTISNETFIVDLAKMPHILVAGATGQGKSVGINAVITSLLYKKHPSQLKFVFVDPKKVELNLYSIIEKHFLAKMPDEEEPIITDVQKVRNTLNSVCIEMDQRYDLLKMAHARNLKEYNKKFTERKLNPEKGHHFMPYIVVVVDEFADLIMTAGKEIEAPIARIAQLARAVGIHMIIATQRPSANIITGPIKANFPARIAFKVASMVDSRTILDSPGANQLIGKGDMLILSGNETTRIQCAFVDTPEVEAVCQFIAEQRSFPSAFMLPEYIEEGHDALEDTDLRHRDELFDDAARMVIQNQSGSTSSIQRKFSIGYNRAGRIMDQLELAGIVGASEGSKARRVLISSDYEFEQIMQEMI